MKRLAALGVLLAALALFAPRGIGATEKKEDIPDTGKWVSLFNGKDLTGWKTHPKDRARWSVKDGCIVGEGPAGHLFTERGDYVNFRFRLEAKISDKGNSGQYFRATFAPAFPPGYEAQIDSTHADPIRTGSLYPDGRDNYSDAEKKQMIVREMLVKPDEWF